MISSIELEMSNSGDRIWIVVKGKEITLPSGNIVSMGTVYRKFLTGVLEPLTVQWYHEKTADHMRDTANVWSGVNDGGYADYEGFCWGYNSAWQSPSDEKEKEIFDFCWKTTDAILKDTADLDVRLHTAFVKYWTAKKIELEYSLNQAQLTLESLGET